MKNINKIIAFISLAVPGTFFLSAEGSILDCPGEAAWCKHPICKTAMLPQGTRYRSRSGLCLDTPKNTFYYEGHFYKCEIGKTSEEERAGVIIDVVNQRTYMIQDKRHYQPQGLCCFMPDLDYPTRCTIPERVVPCPSDQIWNGKKCVCLDSKKHIESGECVSLRNLGMRWSFFPRFFQD